MKRFVSLLLLLSLLLGCALAEREPMKLLEVDSASSFWRAHRDIAYERVRLRAGNDLLTALREGDVDVSILRLNRYELSPFIEEDVLADLSGSPAIREAVSRMPPWIQAHVSDQDGRILALPTRALVRSVNWYQDAWDAAGLTEADVPHSFTELLDFLDAWATRVAEHPEKDVCVSRLVRWSSGNEKYDYVYWLLDMLMVMTEMQQRYKGQPVSFDTPQFIALAERCRRTGLALYQAEPRKNKRQNMMQLFQSDLYGGEHANNGLDYGLSHTVPLRLSNDQPALTWINMEVHVISRDSPWLEEGLALLESVMENKPWYFQYALYSDFAAGDYLYDGRAGHVDAGWLQDYQEYEGVFVFYPSAFNQRTDGSTQKEALMEDFFSGKLSAEAFAKGLDQITH